MSGLNLRPENDPLLDPTPSVSAMQNLRGLLGPAIQSHQGMAVFDIDQHMSYLMVSEGSHGHVAPVVHFMHLGLKMLTDRTFKKRMPNGAQLETAILVVEDAVMPLARLVPPSTVLATRDPLLLHIARTAAGDMALGEAFPAPDCAPPAVSREAIETLFNQAADQVLRGVPDTRLPQEPVWLAGLLVLREAMHHWQFPMLRLLPREWEMEPGTVL